MHPIVKIKELKFSVINFWISTYQGHTVSKIYCKISMYITSMTC